MNELTSQRLAADRVAQPALRPIALTLLATCIAAVAVWVHSGVTPAAAVVLAGVGIGFAVHVAGLVPSLAAIGLLLVPPGVAGENSAVAAVAALSLVLALVAVTSDPESSAPLPRGVVALMGLTALLFPAAAMLQSSPANLALAAGALWALCTAVIVMGRASTAFLAATVRALTALAVVAVCSYFVSSGLGFRQSVTFEGSSRDVLVYFPFTVIRGDAGSLFHEPRFALFSGEPGLGALILLVAIWGALRLFHGPSRVLLALILLAGGVLTQSTGFLFAILSFGVVVAVERVARTRGRIPAAALASVALPLAYVVSRVLISSKASTEKLSLTDRGFLGGSASGEINLLALLQERPYLAVHLFVLLGLLTWHSRTRPLDVGLAVAIGLTGLAAQPIHVHPGVWLLLAVCVLFVGPARDAWAGRAHG